MYRPLQPQFKIRVFNGKRVDVDTRKKITAITSRDSDDYVDIEQFVAYPVTYEEQATLLNTISFTVDKHTDVLLYYFFIGQSVTLYGGYYSDNSSSMKHVFSGTVTRIRTKFSDNGRVSFTVECMNYGFTKIGKDFKNFVYPDKRSPRSFAQKDILTVEDIIKGIAEANNMDIGKIELSSEVKAIRFDKKNILYQKGESDWKFLTELAQDYGCTVWMSSDEKGNEKLYFMSKEKAFREQSKDIAFLYPLYAFLYSNNNTGEDYLIKDTEIQKFEDSSYNRPRLLKSVTVDEDISMANAVSRSAVYFDKETGEYMETVSEITTDKNGDSKMVRYELDEGRVAWVRKNRPDVAKKIMSGVPTGMQWGDDPTNPEFASFYYKVKEIYDEKTAVFDKAFFGVTLTAKCNQDLNIRSQRTYKIRGILSYRSKDLETSFFLRGLKHIWDTDGNWTELDFIR